MLPIVPTGFGSHRQRFNLNIKITISIRQWSLVRAHFTNITSFKPNTDKWLHALWCAGRNYLSIRERQWCSRWSLRLDNKFHSIFHWAGDWLSLPRLKLMHVSKRGPRGNTCFIYRYRHHKCMYKHCQNYNAPHCFVVPSWTCDSNWFISPAFLCHCSCRFIVLVPLQICFIGTGNLWNTLEVLYSLSRTTSLCQISKSQDTGWEFPAHSKIWQALQ